MSTAAVATAREDEPSPNTITTGDGDKKSFADLYDLDKELGRGAFSVVKLGHSKASQEEFAIKIITKAEMHDFDKACLKNELAVMQTLLPPHEHIVRLFDVHEEDQFWYLVLEKVNGGELLDRLIAKNTYSECEARDVSKIVMEAMRHCHDHNICHRDLKPENLLLASPTVRTMCGVCRVVCWKVLVLTHTYLLYFTVLKGRFNHQSGGFWICQTLPQRGFENPMWIGHARGTRTVAQRILHLQTR